MYVKICTSPPPDKEGGGRQGGKEVMQKNRQTKIDFAIPQYQKFGIEYDGS